MPYLLYCVAVQLCVTVGFPLHFVLNIMQNGSASENIKNLTLSITATASALKFAHNALKQRKLRELQQFMAELDMRTTSAKELEYYRRVRRNVRRIELCITGVCVTVGVTMILMFLFRSERTLLLPAYFPFDWRASTWKLYAANFYQVVAIFLMLPQNLADDFMPPTILAILGGHVKLLGIRVAQLGYEHPEDHAGNEAELKRCINDQKCLLRMLDCTQEILSIPMFVQLMTAASNICLAFSAVTFYTSDPLEVILHISHLMGIFLEIFPACFYGAYMQTLFERLCREMYTCNWTGQSRTFRKSMILFCERSLKEPIILAGGIVQLNLYTFVSTMKGAYSLLAAIASSDQ